MNYKEKYLLLKNNDLTDGGLSSFVRGPIYNDYINVKIPTTPFLCEFIRKILMI